MLAFSSKFVMFVEVEKVENVGFWDLFIKTKGFYPKFNESYGAKNEFLKDFLPFSKQLRDGSLECKDR